MAKKKSGIKVDLSNVQSGSKTVPEGNYQVKLSKAEIDKSQSGNDYIKMEFTITEGDRKGSKLFHNCSLQPQALFNLKSVLEALGFEIPGKAFDLDLSDILGLTCEVEVSHELYEGKKKARITEFIDPEGGSDDDSDDEVDITEVVEGLDSKDLKKLAKELGIKAKGKSDEDLVDEISEEDEEEVQSALEELGLMPEEDEEEEGEDEEDEEDEEEAEDEEEEDDTDYSEMTLKELKAEAKERGLKVKKGMDKDEIIELLEEDDEE